MSQLILHHYPQSPFAEKARLMLGLKGLAWDSVIIPRVMPKPDLVALTGGYRRTPVLQVGADIYCDTALIARRLEREQADPPLFPPGREAVAATLAHFADQVLFQHAVALNFQPEALAARFAGVPEAQVRAFAEDRRALFGSGNASRLPIEVARPQWATLLARLDRQLRDDAFLLGATPCVADIATYHPLWFVAGNAMLAPTLEPFDALRAWMERIAALGHGGPSDLTSEQALARARASAPADLAPNDFLDPSGFDVGQTASVAPTDYGVDPVTGVLAWQDAEQIAIDRVDERAGRVRVHFPRLGFRVAAA
jgi:glutathione S-transferase